MHATISPERMVALPSDLMSDLGLNPGDDIRFVKTEQGYLIMTSEKTHNTDEQRLQYATFVLHESQNVIDKLTNISLEDDIYSADEIYLCNVVNEKVFEYQEFLKKVLLDRRVTEEEYERIENFWKEIEEGAYNAANRDNDISIEEEALLTALTKIIKDLH